MSNLLETHATRVLVVDDHDFFRVGLRSLLEQEGFEVAAAGGGEAALRCLAGFAPDVVVMDMCMTGMSGVEATRAIRAARPGTPVIMLTAVEDHEQIVQAIRAGASGYLLKDAQLGEIVAGIRATAAGECAFSPRPARVLVDRLQSERDEEPASVPQPYRLSERERQVLSLLARGYDNAQIGHRLYVSRSTVKNHVSSLLAKLGVDNRVQAATHAFQNGLVDEEPLTPSTHGR